MNASLNDLAGCLLCFENERVIAASAAHAAGSFSSGVKSKSMVMAAPSAKAADRLVQSLAFAPATPVRGTPAQVAELVDALP